MNKFVHIGTDGSIVIDDPPEQATDEEARAYMQGVRAELNEAFAGKPQSLKINLRSGQRGGAFPSASRAIESLIFEVHDRVRELKTA
ncbi:hypothetical protein A3A39_03845 [Candidatus Kaiserbacteria bacterium RIFCSPLOWO2_01_FULL_54_13]|uniref:Uncharacterized protein n=1 Tax=Candidatus Kaiserbacteria bacterium RIFCSPLOWO2_01_FULL_54_13 TaxID=1798512 RepID=A0A1F6F232_9BACT|nr:MAG: hypothetical protein A3A39_03845 [Candidatus Kaiserbacteria bacterium RIFCSPLOWO2_01_FULL_54_13]